VSTTGEGGHNLRASEARLEEAAHAAVAREKRREAPRGAWQDGLWLPAGEERRPCCEAIAPPTLANRQALENHCRSQAHVAQLFAVPLPALRQRVRELRRAEEREAGDQARERTVRAFHRAGSGSTAASDLLFEASAQGRIDGLREMKQEAAKLQEILPALLAAQADDGLLPLLQGASESNRRLGLALDYVLNMERTNQVAQEVRELVAELHGGSRRKRSA
jgi:hypothetical protein